MIIFTYYQAYTWLMLSGPSIPLNLDPKVWKDPDNYRQN